MDWLEQLVCRKEPVLALAPMQDVTDYPFWKLMREYGGADLYFTEFFRVHATSHLEPHILKSVVENPTGRPVIAQMIGNDVAALVRTAKELEQYPVAGIDLNLGCPAPVVYRKCAGGGLLREPAKIDAILGALRENVTTRFTVKTRIGFDDPKIFDSLLKIYSRHSIDLLTVHARTVKEMYAPAVHYDYITRSVAEMRCPVLANGGVDSVHQAARVLSQTGARGLMIGRGAIRNPWLFDQIRQHQRGQRIFIPTARDVLEYVQKLFEAVRPPGIKHPAHVQKMKKYMNFIGAGIHPDFLFQIRRATTEEEFFAICREFLDHDQPMTLETLPSTPGNPPGQLPIPVGT